MTHPRPTDLAPIIPPNGGGHVYSPATLDLTGWWKFLWIWENYAAGDGPATPITADNHPPQQICSLYLDGTYQQTSFVYLTNVDIEPTWSAGVYGRAGRLWTNRTDPRLSEADQEGLFHNGFVSQQTDQSQPPALTGGLVESPGEFLVTDFVAYSGIVLTIHKVGNAEEPVQDGDLEVIAAWADNPVRERKGIHPTRPTFRGTWLDAHHGLHGAITLTPQVGAPPHQ